MVAHRTDRPGTNRADEQYVAIERRLGPRCGWSCCRRRLNMGVTRQNRTGSVFMWRSAFRTALRCVVSACGCQPSDSAPMPEGPTFGSPDQRPKCFPSPLHNSMTLTGIGQSAGQDFGGPRPAMLYTHGQHLRIWWKAGLTSFRRRYQRFRRRDDRLEAGPRWKNVRGSSSN